MTPEGARSSAVRPAIPTTDSAGASSTDLQVFDGTCTVDQVAVRLGRPAPAASSTPDTRPHPGLRSRCRSPPLWSGWAADGGSLVRAGPAAVVQVVAVTADTDSQYAVRQGTDNAENHGEGCPRPTTRTGCRTRARRVEADPQSAADTPQRGYLRKQGGGDDRYYPGPFPASIQQPEEDEVTREGDHDAASQRRDR